MSGFWVALALFICGFSAELQSKAWRIAYRERHNLPKER